LYLVVIYSIISQAHTQAEEQDDVQVLPSNEDVEIQFLGEEQSWRPERESVLVPIVKNCSVELSSWPGGRHKILERDFSGATPQNPILCLFVVCTPKATDHLASVTQKTHRNKIKCKIATLGKRTVVVQLEVSEPRLTINNSLFTFNFRGKTALHDVAATPENLKGLGLVKVKGRVIQKTVDGCRILHCPDNGFVHYR
jgi:hypothetical protein